MSKFYVYTITNRKNKERSCIYVDANRIEDFARNKYDPRKMKFSGVMVEADSAHQAHEFYNTFSGEIISVDEPACTANLSSILQKPLDDLKDAFKQLEKASNKLLIQALAKGLSQDVIRMNERFSQMARAVRLSSNSNPEVSVADLYERIKKKYIDQIEDNDYIED